MPRHMRRISGIDRTGGSRERAIEARDVMMLLEPVADQRHGVVATRTYKAFVAFVK